MSEKIKSHFIIPIFIPHQGCPHRCVFCQQNTITNRAEGIPSADGIRNIIELAIQSKRFPGRGPKEVALYGGTFTALPNTTMREILDVVRPFLKNGTIQSIRLSTRPDALGKDKLLILESYGVSTVELGVQSMDDKVLLLAQRGHSSSDTATAFTVLKERGFKAGVQLMPGLPGDSAGRFMETINKVVALKPDMARLYPTLVIRGTKLAQWYKQGTYTPLGLEETVNLCKEACIRLEDAGIPVIRIGLMSSPALLKQGEIIAGPWHPSLGFLVRSAIHLEKVKPSLPFVGKKRSIVLFAPQKETPLIRGHKNRGIQQIEAITGASVKGVVSDNSVPAGEIAFEVV
ncbi:MAG TPA: radical SAM protein [Desulfatiglandales bacterium]|nr:radical SAM protein [Desulfatiglandales bacterium]